MATRELKLLLTLKDKASKELGKFRGKLDKMKPAFQKMSMIGVAGLGAITVGLGSAVNKASDAQEIFNKFDVVFGDVSDGAEKMAKDLRDNFGLAESTSKDLLSATGDMLTGFGMSGEQALDLAGKTNKLAIDLASFTNIEGGAERASKALTKALLGERESVKELGIAILEEDVKAKIEAMEIAGEFTDETYRQKKAYATLKIAVEQSKNAIGDYARTQDSLANRKRLLKERTKELTETLGSVFIPMINKVLEKIIPVINKMAEWIKEHPILTKIIIIATTILFGLLTVLGLIGLALPVIIAGFTAISWPIIGIIALIAVLIATGYYLIKNWDTVKEMAGLMWETLKDLFSKGVDFLSKMWSGLWDGMKSIFNNIWDGIMSTFKGYINTLLEGINFIIRQINKISFSVPSWVPGIGGKSWGINIPEIPLLEKGGIVTKPTLAMVGEAGPEAVIPLNKVGGFGGLTINVYGDVSGEELITKVSDGIMNNLRLNYKLSA